MTQDILILLLPYLHSLQATSLFQICMTPEVLGGKDNGVQKRGYKILTKLLESGKVTVDAPSIIQRLDDLCDGLSPAAKKVGASPAYLALILLTHDEGPLQYVVLVGSLDSPLCYAHHSFLNSRSSIGYKRTIR